MRNKVLVGNWKMNNSFSDLLDFTEVINDKYSQLENVEIGVCIPSVYLMVADKEGALKIGAQNVYYENSGAFTGELSVNHLNDCLVTYCIIGHSERREIFNESDEMINKKIKAVSDANITPIICIGENLEQYEAGKSKEIVENQLVSALAGVDSIEGFIFAYEPIWAIGTGKSATSEYAETMCGFVREVLAKNFDSANETIIQYGGSVKPDNIKEYLSMENVDGALVGGASLKSTDFIALVEAIK